MKKYVCEVFELSDQELEATKAFHRGKKNKIRFLGHILYHHKLFSLKRGAYSQICSTNVAVGLGVTSRSICNYLKELRKLNWISVENDMYVVGHRSKGYVCTGLVLREMYVSRFPTSSSESGLKKAKLVERRRSAWNINKPIIKAFDSATTVAMVESGNVIETSQEVFKAYADISKLYLGNHLDLIRDVSLFLSKNKSMRLNKTHRDLFYRSLKMRYKTLKITKKFTQADFLNGRGGISANYLFTLPDSTAASFLQRQG